MRTRFGMAILVVACTATACSSGGGQTPTSPAGSSSPASSSDTARAVSLPASAQKIMAKPAYQGARWTYEVSDLKTGKVLLANRPSEMAFTASTAKQFTVGAAYNTIGTNTKLTTPVYATGTVTNGVLHGNLALVASGDLTMGGRNAPQGRADESFNEAHIDHVYGDLAPNAVKPLGHPLAGLDSLTQQIAAKGIRKVSGNVLIDDRLWQPFAGGEGTVQPMFINDNVLDITVTPGASGALAAIATSPVTTAYQVISKVKTGAGSKVALQVEPDTRQPHRLVVTGTIGASAGPRLTIYRIPDPASWARTLFIESLKRAGVTVTADPLATNPADQLPSKSSYQPTRQVAKFTSPPLSAFGSLILKTSYNTGANAMLCLLAVHQGSTDCLAGLKPIRAMVDKAGLTAADVVLIDGQGADPASASPAQMVTYLRWTQTQPWGATLKAGQPVLGESGTLASSGANSPAKGKIQAKTGTSAHLDPGNDRALFNVQRLAGFMTTSDGRQLVFDIAMSSGTYPDVQTGIGQAGNDVAAVAAAIQQAVS
ncbi:D-alanyl-D-alanine carboxypeptidase/D-alanyl-D-alanine-endopeptidase [Dermatophilaceae bacterium Sec6.4]